MRPMDTHHEQHRLPESRPSRSRHCCEFQPWWFWLRRRDVFFFFLIWAGIENWRLGNFRWLWFESNAWTRVPRLAILYLLFSVTPYPRPPWTSQASRSGAGTRVITCTISPARSELATTPHWISLRNSTSLLQLKRSRVHARRISNPIGPYLPVNREGLISIAVWRRPESTESTADTSTKHNLNSNSIYSCMVGAGSVLNDKCTFSELFSFPSLGFLSIP